MPWAHIIVDEIGFLKKGKHGAEQVLELLHGLTAEADLDEDAGRGNLPCMPNPSALSDRVQVAFAVTLPPRYRAFLDGEYAKHNKKYAFVQGLSGKRQVTFDSPKLLSVFRTNGVKIATTIPLATLEGDSMLLTIDLGTPGCAVGTWDEGSFNDFLPSLDALLGRLLAKGEQGIEERLVEARKRANELHKAADDAKAVRVLDAAIGTLTATDVRDDPPVRAALARALNLRGTCLDGDAALASYEAACACGTEGGHYAILNLCSHYSKQHDYARVIAMAEQLFELDEYKDGHTFLFGKLYLALAQQAVGDATGARATVAWIAKSFRKEPDQLAKAHEQLVEAGADELAKLVAPTGGSAAKVAKAAGAKVAKAAAAPAKSSAMAAKASAKTKASARTRGKTNAKAPATTKTKPAKPKRR